ncbi:MAG: esterase family protein [Bacteroidales bacterium]|nr:esterase family protein [Bacteroidales bacterium]
MKRMPLLLAALLVSLMGMAAVKTIEKINTTLVPNSPMEVTVLVPEGYEPGTQFPTVYLLNGYDGNHTSWSSTQPDLGKLADQYGMVIVMPDGRDSWYWDSPAHPEMKMESFITTELVPYIDSNFPTLPSADKRAITGLSMGGQGAMYLAMRHPDLFKNVGSTSGGLDIRAFPKNWKMANWLGDAATNQDVWEEHAIPTLAAQLQPGQLNIIFDCGVDDFFAGVNNALHEQLVAAGIPHDYISRPGAHTHPYWRNAILYQLLYFNQAFNNSK